MSRKICLIVVACIILLQALPADAYNARLLGMGQMAGIITDERDYLDYIYKINDVKRKLVSFSYLSNFFSNSFPQNDQPSSSIYEYERKGARDGLECDFVMPLTDTINFGVQKGYEFRDYRASYIDAAGDWQTLDRTGRAEINTLILGYRVAPWFDIAVSYDDTSQVDNYGGSETGREGVDVLNENSRYQGLSYGTRFHSEHFWFGMCVGDYNKTQLSYEASSYPLSYSIHGPGRIALSLGGSLFDKKLIIDYGGSMRRIGLSSKFNAALGLQIRPDEQWLVGFGVKMRQDSDQNGTFTRSSLNLGGEYKVRDSLVLRAGIINKADNIDRLGFLGYSMGRTANDYTLGLGYELFNCHIDLAYYNYSGIIGGSYDWSAMSSVLMRDSVYTSTTGRNSVYAFSISRKI